MKKIIFKKINFIDCQTSDFDKITKKNKLFVFPSGPGLADIDKSKNYYISLQKADSIFFDSGLFVLLLYFFKNVKVKKFSGYKFLKLFFKYLSKNKKKSVFCIEPNNKILISNRKYFKKLGIKKIYNFLAPNYDPENLADKKLLKKLIKIKPNFIITNIGGGTQEILGLYLKKNLNFKTKIFCTGGAISFFTGDQAPIGNVIDKLFLGWLVRIIYNPQNFLLRYIKAFNLIRIFFKYKNTIKIKK